MNSAELQRLTDLEEDILPSLNREALLLRLLLNINTNRRDNRVWIRVPMAFYGAKAAGPLIEAVVVRKTCDTCPAENCYYRDDDYNTNGDCLAEK